MTLRKLLLVFGIFFVFNQGLIRAQDNCIAISINEYCASNIPGNGVADAFGEFSDWVELKCNFTSQVSLNGYYLSNDRFNLYKWAFPSSFIMGSGQHKLVWLSGRNTVKSGEYHANFTLEQCKNQWLIVSNSQGVIQDSVFVQPTKGGHSWGRIDCYTTGMNAFRLFVDNAKSPEGANSGIFWKGYAPTPRLYVSTETNFTIPNSGGFYPEVQIARFKMQGQTYDTSLYCYDIFFTRDGSIPIPGYPAAMPTEHYTDTTTGVAIDRTQVIRSIAVPRQPNAACGTGADILPSFIESNTYFIDPTHQDFSPDFGVVSVTMDESWILTGGSVPTTVHVEYYDKEKQMSEGYAQINRPINESWLTDQKGFYMSIDDRFGSGCNFEGPVFNVECLGTTTRTMFPTLHLKGGDLEAYAPAGVVPGDEVYGTGLRDVFMQSLAAKNNLNVSPLHIKPVIGFINGKYSGVYNLYETYDKYYENHYNGQPLDSLDLNWVHLGEGSVNYWDNTFSKTVKNDWGTAVYDLIMNNPMNGANNSKYKLAMERLDKSSFIDYMILNSFAQNQDVFKYNVAFGRGYDMTKPGYKWHYYLWNMPSIFNFTTITNSGAPFYPNPASPPCYIHTSIITPQKDKYDGHGNMLALLMGTYPNKTKWGNEGFKLEYMNRYQDLLNGPLKCDNLKKHFECVLKLYQEEMLCHGDVACEVEGDFHSVKEPWDTNMNVLRRGIQLRCYTLENQFNKSGCYGLPGPHDLTVDVQPAGAGLVKLNSMILDTYKWYGKYYQTTLSFKAIPTNTNYAFHHWEFNGPIPKDPLSMDSVGVNFNISGDVIAVFTDKQAEIIPEGVEANVPTAFTPNGDGRNDIFRPLGAAEYVNEYQMTIWNRWGEEVFRSVDIFSGWDGNFKGQMAQTGVYAYVITYKNMYNESKVVKGNVTLTR